MSNTVEEINRAEDLAKIVATLKDRHSTTEALADAIREGYRQNLVFSRTGDIRIDLEMKDAAVVQANSDILLVSPDVDEKKRFYLYHKENGMAPLVKQVSLDKALDFVQPADGPVIPRPQKPALGFWGTLRNAFSFLFGKPEGQKRYEREMNYYRAQKAQLMNEQYDIEGIDYNHSLLNMDKDTYVRNDQLQQADPGLTAPAGDVPQRDSVSAENRREHDRRMLEDANLVLQDDRLITSSETVQYGAIYLADVINECGDTKEAKALVSYLAGVRNHPNENEKDAKAIAGHFTFIKGLCVEAKKAVQQVDMNYPSSRAYTAAVNQAVCDMLNKKLPALAQGPQLTKKTEPRSSVFSFLTK